MPDGRRRGGFPKVDYRTGKQNYNMVRRETGVMVYLLRVYSVKSITSDKFLPHRRFLLSEGKGRNVYRYAL